MQPKLLENRKWFSLQVYLLILALAFLSGFEPVLHNHDLDEAQKDCASCTWSHSSVSEPIPTFQNSLPLNSQNILITQAQGAFIVFSFLNLSRAPPFSRSQD